MTLRSFDQMGNLKIEVFQTRILGVISFGQLVQRTDRVDVTRIHSLQKQMMTPQAFVSMQNVMQQFANCSL